MKTHEEMRSEVMRKIKFGQVITVYESESSTIKARAVAFYPEYILCVGLTSAGRGAGYNICLRYHELWTRLQTSEIRVNIPEKLKGVRS